MHFPSKNTRCSNRNSWISSTDVKLISRETDGHFKMILGTTAIFEVGWLRLLSKWYSLQRLILRLSTPPIRTSNRCSLFCSRWASSFVEVIIGDLLFHPDDVDGSLFNVQAWKVSNWSHSSSNLRGLHASQVSWSEFHCFLKLFVTVYHVRGIGYTFFAYSATHKLEYVYDRNGNRDVRPPSH